MNNVKTDEQIVEQSNGLEKVICELERLNALVYRGYSIDTVSRYITELKRKYTPISDINQEGTVDFVIKIYRAHADFPEGGLMS